MGAYTLGEGCNLIKAKELTKPTEFYVLFAVAEVYGLFFFVYCMIRLKKDIDKFRNIESEGIESEENQQLGIVNYFSDDVRKLVLLTTGELPLLMLLEYFYVERPLGSDVFFENNWIAINNVLTAFEIIVLILACIDIIADNIKHSGIETGFRLNIPMDPMDPSGAQGLLTQELDAEGIGRPDGKLDMMEVIVILNTICITVATVIRLIVNCHQKL